LVRRLDLDDIDLGFALLPDQEGRGLAFEASQAVMEYARGKLHLKRLIAITVPDNHRSVSLLTRLGMEKDGLITLGNEQLLRMAIEFS
jgi:RimJ/RimL family protein N-acetyltransferase